MQTLRIAFWSALVCVACSVEARAQQIQFQQQVEVLGDDPLQQVGPPGRQQRTGSGRIRGRVISAESGSPVRRAQVRVTGPDIAPRTALTDANGRFEFADLPDGRFTVLASKAGYMAVQVRADAPVRVGKADPARRQASDGQGGHGASARERDRRANRG